MKNNSDKNLFENLSPNILVLEDDLVNQKIITEKLQTAGFSVLAPNSLSDISNILKNNTIDACIIDLHLSDFNDEKSYKSEFSAKFLNNLKNENVAIIAYSSYADVADDINEKYFDVLAPKSSNGLGIGQNYFLKLVNEAITKKKKASEAHPPEKSIKSHVPLVQFNSFDPMLYKAIIEAPDLLKTLNWRIFEELLADILNSFGYKIDLMQGTKDGGIDIVAISKNTEFGEQKYLVQAKRWKNKVGVEPVQQLMFLHNKELATKSCLATTSYFTKGAWDLKRQYNWQLELKDYSGILSWVKKVWETKQYK